MFIQQHCHLSILGLYATNPFLMFINFNIDLAIRFWIFPRLFPPLKLQQRHVNRKYNEYVARINVLMIVNHELK